MEKDVYITYMYHQMVGESFEYKHIIIVFILEG